MNTSILSAALGAAVLAVSLPAHALLAVGAKAPDFVLPAAQAGNQISVDSKALRSKGPVVVYFYPAAFTPGCSVEAKLFAEAMPQFAKAGASVIGVSGDDITKLKKFSVSHCQGKFPVASDAGLKVAKQYEAAGAFGFAGFASRVSYVIGQDGKVVYAHTDSGPQGHVSESLKAVRGLVPKL
ncbi:peroxiredoxin [Perlucidibaca piscinae]|uniref:peroxiredoxin n=1 Tax=Perlucidibaca piscinae TaxID=392589 RepID=UPI0003B50E22|nr:peroxiredoxin [Perlucidibaca piscinae]